MGSQAFNKEELLNQTTIAFLAALWLTLFLVFIAPFDISDLSFALRLKYMYGYGIVFFVGYTLNYYIIYSLLKQRVTNEITRKTLFYLLLFSSIFIGSFTYYKSPVLNGEFSIADFTLDIYLPTLLIFIPIMLFCEWGIKKLRPFKKHSRKNRSGRQVDSEWKPKIEQLMEEKIYLDPDLTLNKMAELLGTNNTILSRVINNVFKMNFNDFINSYRLKAFQDSVFEGHHKKHTLNGVAQNCGFNSKATFNRVFKKQIGISPTQFVKNIENKATDTTQIIK